MPPVFLLLFLFLFLFCFPSLPVKTLPCLHLYRPWSVQPISPDKIKAMVPFSYSLNAGSSINRRWFRFAGDGRVSDTDLKETQSCINPSFIASNVKCCVVKASIQAPCSPNSAAFDILPSSTSLHTSPCITPLLSVFCLCPLLEVCHSNPFSAIAWLTGFQYVYSCHGRPPSGLTLSGHLRLRLNDLTKLLASSPLNSAFDHLELLIH